MQSLSAQEIYEAANVDVLGEVQMNEFGGKIGPDGSTGENIERAIGFLYDRAKAGDGRKGLAAICLTLITKPISILTLGITKTGGKGDKRGWKASVFRSLPQTEDDLDQDDAEAVKTYRATVAARLLKLNRIISEHKLQGVDMESLNAYARVNVGRCKAIAFYAILHPEEKYDSPAMAKFRMTHFPDGIARFNSAPDRRDSRSLAIFKEDFEKYKRSLAIYKARANRAASVSNSSIFVPSDRELKSSSTTESDAAIILQRSLAKKNRDKKSSSKLDTITEKDV